MKIKPLLFTLLLIFLTKTAFSQCPIKQQGKIEGNHLQIAVEMNQLLENNLSDQKFNNQVSPLLDKMYDNLCGDSKVDFAGGISQIVEQKNKNEVMVVIDDTLRGRKNNFIVRYIAKTSENSQLGQNLLRNYEEGEIIIFTFKVDETLQPKHRDLVLNLLRENKINFPVIFNYGQSANIAAVFPIGITLSRVLNTEQIIEKMSQN